MIQRFSIKSFICGAIMGCIVICALERTVHKNKQYVYVDVGKVVSSVVRAVSAENPTNMQGLIDVYKVKFRDLLAQYAKEHHVIVFSSPKPVSGAEDVTDWFIGHLHVNGHGMESSK